VLSVQGVDCNRTTISAVDFCSLCQLLLLVFQQSH
jgi:hypothetical protein